jgi:hypothetical protein
MLFVMNRMDRRRFLLAGAAATASLKSFAQTPADSAASRAAQAPAASVAAQPVKIELHPGQYGANVPENFVGVSYETQQLSEPNFFSPENHGLVEQFRALSPNGVLRLGGNTSDYGYWKPTPQSKPPKRKKRPYKVGDPNPNLSYPVTPEAVENLRGFLDATGWTCLYGINFGTSTPQLAADEASFVAKTLGLKLEYFQVGNEADRFGSTIRDPQTWNANKYFDEWIAFANAIKAQVPSARFGLPDTAGNPEWYAVVVDRLLQIPGQVRPDIAALTHHYYFGGPPSNPKVTLDAVLHPDPNVDKLYQDVSAAAARLGKNEHRTVPYRMTEGNTCYRGGKPGVSDVFGVALWAADYLLKLAYDGYAGVNLHGGEGNMVANSLGGTLPGEELMPDRKVPHPRPFYTPIADIGKDYVAEPVSYGMRFAGVFAGATFIKLDFDPGEINATAYAAKLGNGHTAVAIINKDATRDLTINQPEWKLEQTLTGPSLTATSNVRFGPAESAKSNKVAAGSAAIFRVG